MKNLLKITLASALLTLVAGLGITSCEKDQVSQTPIAPKLTVEFYMINQGKTEAAGEHIYLTENREIEVEMMRYFVSNMKFYTDNNNYVEPKENLFVLKLENPDYQKFTIELPAGEYQKLSFFPGLDSANNALNPLDFQREHPLSAFHNMHWSWAMQYRFVLLEMRVLHTEPTTPASYHPGTNELLYGSELTFNTPLKLENNKNQTLKIGIDLNALFDGPGGTIDMNTENQAHADIHDFELTRKFMRNFAAAFRVME